MKSRPATFTLLFCPSLFTLREFFNPKLKEFNNSLAKPNVNRLRLSSTWINIVCECGSLSLSLFRNLSLSLYVCVGCLGARE